MRFGKLFTLGVSAAALVAAAAPALSLSVKQRIPGPDGGWDLLSVDPESHRLFVARTDGVMAVNLDNGQVMPKFVPGARLHAAFAIPGTGLGIATAGATNSAILFDKQSGQIRAEVKTGASPDAAIYEPASKTVWVMNAHDGTISVVDPVKASVSATIPVGGSLELPALDGRGHLFVNVEDKNEVAELDIAARKVVKHIPLPGCDGPTGLVYVPSGVLISACANGVADVTRASDGKVMGSIAVGPRPDGAVYDSARRRAYIPSGGDGTLTVIDTSGAMPHAIGKVQTQTGARTAALDPRTGAIYLPAAHYAPAEAGQRPKMVPGSFEVLVVK